jgi:outer membrane protein assembly factor BamB
VRGIGSAAIVIVAALLIAAAVPVRPCSAGQAGKLIASPVPGWAQWRGPRRDGVSDETGLLDTWPAGGPKLLWSAEELGGGYCSPVIGGGGIYITGDVGQQLVVFALGLDGKPKWKAANGQAWKKPFPGARGSCCWDDGMVYQINGYGRVVCLDARSGKEIWAVESLKEFRAKVPSFGIAECVLVDGPRVIVSPGGARGLMAALDKKTGKTLWTSTATASAEETAGYGSPILIEYAGRRVAITSSSLRTYAVDVETGKTLWRHDVKLYKNADNTIPVFGEDSVFITNASQIDQVYYRLRINPAGDGVTKDWALPVSNGHGSFVFTGGRLYGTSDRQTLGWLCIEASTGKVLGKLEDLFPGSSIFADGHIYALCEKGTMALLKPADGGFEVKGRFELISGKKDVWAHPVILAGRLYLRYAAKLYCYDIRK